MISTVLLYLQLLVHPFHVSVMDMTYKEDQKALQISIRIFLDDLEKTLGVYSGNSGLDITDEGSWEFVNEQLKKYLLEHLKLSDHKGAALEMNYVGAEIEKDAMWCYLEVEKLKKLKSVKVWNSLLIEAFDDQENLVHFRAFDTVKSERLYRGQEEKVFEWE